jgi:hypothetical protein
MKPEEQRIAIAEACGWTEIGVIDYLCGIHPQMLNAKAYDGSPLTPPIWEIPDYLHDLNAMHEVERNILNDSLALINYARELRYIVNSEGFAKNERFICSDWHATAAQRAEAFLRTIGKWTANPNEL